jgi:hypothetical protein
MFKRLFFIFIFISCPVFAAVDFAEIKQSAHLSAASYTGVEQIESRLNRMNFDLVHHKTLPASQLSYFFARSASGEQILSFRGTSNLENALVDLDLALIHDPITDIQLHQGFAGAAKAALDDVKSKLDKTQPVQTTGHSLGGAIAVIIAMYLEKEGFELEQVITFGQPKVTNVTGAKAFAHMPLIRVVTPTDLVPLVPPLSPLQLQNLDIYWHNGIEVILLADQQYSITEGLKSMMRATKVVNKVPDESNLEAHQMATYLSLIEANQEGAKLVPYKMELNLFGFSFD